MPQAFPNPLGLLATRKQEEFGFLLEASVFLSFHEIYCFKAWGGSFLLAEAHLNQKVLVTAKGNIAEMMLRDVFCL